MGRYTAVKKFTYELSKYAKNDRKIDAYDLY